jgi:tetratricopeptide (TPR) repeat protein
MVEELAEKKVCRDEDERLSPRMSLHWFKNAPWLGTKTFISLMVVCTILFMVAMAFLLKENRSIAPLSISFSTPRLDDAIASNQKILKTNSEDLRALTRLGILQFQKGVDFYPQAINEFEEARSLGSLDPRIFYYLGLMYHDLGFYPFAIEQYQRYLRNFPENKDIRQKEAKLLYQAGRYAEASSEYQRLNFRFPKDPVIDENLGLSLWKLKNIDRAADIFQKLETSSPGSVKRDEFYLGEISLDRKDDEGALGHFLKSVPAQGEDTGIAPHDIYSSLAAVWQKLGDYSRAKTAWESALSFSPGDLKAKIALKQTQKLLAIKERKERALQRRNHRHDHK